MASHTGSFSYRNCSGCMTVRLLAANELSTTSSNSAPHCLSPVGSIRVLNFYRSFGFTGNGLFVSLCFLKIFFMKILKNLKEVVKEGWKKERLASTVFFCLVDTAHEFYLLSALPTHKKFAKIRVRFSSRRPEKGPEPPRP